MSVHTLICHIHVHFVYIGRELERNWACELDVQYFLPLILSLILQNHITSNEKWTSSEQNGLERQHNCQSTCSDMIIGHNFKIICPFVTFWNQFNISRHILINNRENMPLLSFDHVLEPNIQRNVRSQSCASHPTSTSAG